VLHLVWKNYQAAIPKIVKELRAKKIDTERRYKEVQLLAQNLDSSKMRSIACNYVVNFLQVIDRLISGTSEGNPASNGQTLEEEKAGHGTFFPSFLSFSLSLFFFFFFC
jgi:hypothetical protein